MTSGPPLYYLRSYGLYTTYLLVRRPEELAATEPPHHPLLGCARPGESPEKGLGAEGALGDTPGRGPPYWRSRVLRRQALGVEHGGQGHWVQETA